MHAAPPRFSGCEITNKLQSRIMGKSPVIAAAIEIGTSQINVLVGEITADSVNVIGRGSAPSGEAMRKGEIRDMELISKAFEQAMACGVDTDDGDGLDFHSFFGRVGHSDSDNFGAC